MSKFTTSGGYFLVSKTENNMSTSSIKSFKADCDRGSKLIVNGAVDTTPVTGIIVQTIENHKNNDTFHHCTSGRHVWWCGDITGSKQEFETATDSWYILAEASFSARCINGGLKEAPNPRGDIRAYNP